MYVEYYSELLASVCPFVPFSFVIGKGGGAFAGGLGAHQKTGYLCCMLFVIKATTIIKTDDRRTTGKRYQLSLLTAGVVIGRSAVAPAGGWIVLVACMTTMAMEEAKVAASQARRRGLSSSWRLLSWKIRAMMMPVKALKKWPPKTARG
jgi:hypothetical protein